MPAPPNSDRANMHLADALAELEAAQHTLEKACQLLSPIRGAATRWRRLAHLAERLRAEWHSLNEWSDRDHGLTHDSEQP
jgi:hypothetical protein